MWAVRWHKTVDAQIMAQCARYGGGGHERAQQEGKHGMTRNGATAQISFDLTGGRIFDTAQGILIGIRRCSSETALHELLGAAQRHRMPVPAMAWALVHLATGSERSSHAFTDAQSAADREWGQLFAR